MRFSKGKISETIEQHPPGASRPSSPGRDKAASLTSQFAVSKSGRGGRRTFPYAFTEHGAVMVAKQS
jgi:hypothetical protein